MKIIICQQWKEREGSNGATTFGYSLHLTEQNRIKCLNAMPRFRHPYNEAYGVEASDGLYETIERSGGSITMEGCAPKPPAGTKGNWRSIKGLS